MTDIVVLVERMLVESSMTVKISSKKEVTHLGRDTSRNNIIIFGTCPNNRTVPVC
jgi:hypothetical protein